MTALTTLVPTAATGLRRLWKDTDTSRRAMLAGAAVSAGPQPLLRRRSA